MSRPRKGNSTYVSTLFLRYAVQWKRFKCKHSTFGSFWIQNFLVDFCFFLHLWHMYSSVSSSSSRSVKLRRQSRSVHIGPLSWFLVRLFLNWLGISSERSRNGSNFLDSVPHIRQLTSFWRMPPKMAVTTVDAPFMQHLLLADRLEFSCKITERETPLKPPWSSRCRWSKR